MFLSVKPTEESPNRIEEIRRNLGIGRTALARRLGIEVLTLWRIERGITRLDTDRAWKIASELGCSVDFLLGRVATAPLPATSPDSPQQDEAPTQDDTGAGAA